MSVLLRMVELEDVETMAASTSTGRSPTVPKKCTGFTPTITITHADIHKPKHH